VTVGDGRWGRCGIGGVVAGGKLVGPRRGVEKNQLAQERVKFASGTIEWKCVVCEKVYSSTSRLTQNIT